MKFIAYWLMAFCASVSADTYIEKSGNKCPPGWSNTKGNYCVNNSASQDDVIVKSGDKCPPGYSNTRGGYCKK